MKRYLLLTTALLCSAPALYADVEVTMAELRKIGYLPADKAELHPEEKLDIKKRNPFAERKKTVAAKPTEQVETEESKLRTFFDKQKVSGLSKFGDTYTVTMGRLALEPGQIVPPIIPNQTHILRVLKVTNTELEIGWVEDATTGLEPTVPRKIRKKINLQPTVKEYLASEDNIGENSQTYDKDDKGKVVMPRQNVFPNPSDIMENIPPGSDTSVDGVLSAQERQDLQNAEEAAHAPPSPGTRPSPSVPEAAPPPAPEAPPPAVENPEDSVQPDPDLADPDAPPGGAPAGPPGR